MHLSNKMHLWRVAKGLVAVSNNNQWASDDDAGDLLADIFSDTESAAEVEAQRIAAELDRKKQEEAMREQEAEQRRMMEAEAKLQEEAKRQQNMTERRTARLEAIKVEELKEKGEWIDPAIEEAKRKAEEDRRIQEEARRQAEAMVAQQAQHAPVPQAQPMHASAPVAEPPKSKTPLIILAAVLVAIFGAVGAIVAITSGGYTPDNNPYAKVTLEPTEDKDLVIVKASTPLPSAKPVATVAANTPNKKSRKSTRRKVRRKVKPKGKKRGKKPKKLDLGKGDLFGGGF